MKKALLILVIIICTAQLYSAEPIVKFYLLDGSTMQYKISEIQNFKFINSNFTYIMLVWYRGSNTFGDTRSIDSVFFDNNKMKTAIGSHLVIDNLSEIDSITFVRNNSQEIQIGSQIWMLKNLNVDHYLNGDLIPQVTDQAQWANLKTGAWCYYNNVLNDTVYGKLYNWYAVNDQRGLAPKGWHVPTDAEWDTLSNYLGGQIVAGGKMKEMGISHWQAPNVGATNECGFYGLPGGWRMSDGTFDSFGSYGSFWSSTESGTLYAWYRTLIFSDASVHRNALEKNIGFSVRCVRDSI